IMIDDTTSHASQRRQYLGTKNCGLGCLRLDNEYYQIQSNSQRQVKEINSFSEFGNSIMAHSQICTRSPILISLRLAQKLFRREPAISVFDWLFTPTHTSTPHFSTYVGSGLQSVLPDLHPGHG